ncbi:double-stranded RNA-binding protein 1-like [Lycium barbarum]|uniref:double-stranded RNA-binding protein 1-like n=1 Tax=Lycium barbarum TaxID=112863 RepID=UPI00293F2C25|nr:double-stranded RNA-binding protein 1-like [Lycium barbarum]
MYKSKLQEVCQNKKWALPKYCCMKDGEDHDPKFKASVVVNGINFDSPTLCKSSKEAHNEAAKFAFLHFTSEITSIVYVKYITRTNSVAQLALMTLVTVSFEKSNASSYKSFLQELAQHEEICLPEYRTTGVGEPHNLTFLSNVEIEGEIFRGDGAKSKKQAEENAAKVAYTALTKCKSFFAGNPSIVSSDFECEIVKTEPIMDSLSISIDQEKFRGLSHIIRLFSDATKVFMALADEKDMVNASSISLGMQELSVNEKSCSSVESSCNFRSKTISSAAMTPSKSSTLSNANSSARTTAETKSYLLSNRVRVYKYIPDEVFPRGTIVLPIAEDKWAVVSLEFPNEKCG